MPLVKAETYIFLTKWGGFGSGDGQFRFPVGVAVDGSGYVYVLDDNRVQKFGLGYDVKIGAWSTPGWAVLPINMDGVDPG